MPSSMPTNFFELAQLYILLSIFSAFLCVTASGFDFEDAIGILPPTVTQWAAGAIGTTATVEVLRLLFNAYSGSPFVRKDNNTNDNWSDDLNRFFKDLTLPKDLRKAYKQLSGRNAINYLHDGVGSSPVKWDDLHKIFIVQKYLGALIGLEEAIDQIDALESERQRLENKLGKQPEEEKPRWHRIAAQNGIPEPFLGKIQDEDFTSYTNQLILYIQSLKEKQGEGSGNKDMGKEIGEAIAEALKKDTLSDHLEKCLSTCPTTFGGNCEGYWTWRKDVERTTTSEDAKILDWSTVISFFLGITCGNLNEYLAQNYTIFSQTGLPSSGEKFGQRRTAVFEFLEETFGISSADLELAKRDRWDCLKIHADCWTEFILIIYTIAGDVNITPAELQTTYKEKLIRALPMDLQKELDTAAIINGSLSAKALEWSKIEALAGRLWRKKPEIPGRKKCGVKTIDGKCPKGKGDACTCAPNPATHIGAISSPVDYRNFPPCVWKPNHWRELDEQWKGKLNEVEGLRKRLDKAGRCYRCRQPGAPHSWPQFQQSRGRDFANTGQPIGNEGEN